VPPTLIPALLLVLGSPVLAQPVQPISQQSHAANASQARTDVSVVNPTTMQLQVQIQELSSKVDDLTSLIQSLNGSLTNLQAKVAEFRQASEDQYKKLRTTTFLDCYQTAAYSTWGYGDGDIAIRHCTGDLGPMDKVPF
jgi:TolA-binding protein